MQWQFRNRTAIFACIVVVLSSVTARPRSGQIIRLTLPFLTGGPADAMARLVAEQIGTCGGPTMVVESHPGADYTAILRKDYADYGRIIRDANLKMQ